MPRRLDEVRDCGWCGSPYHPLRASSKFCSRMCANLGRDTTSRCRRCLLRQSRWQIAVVSVKVAGREHLASGAGALVCLMPGQRVRDQQMMREYRRTYVAKDPQREVERRRNARRMNRTRDLAKYGIRFADYEALYVWQGGRCACCQTAAATDVDHDHSSGCVRALLCNPCNLMLGHAGDDPGRLARGVEYLTEHNELKEL